MLATAIGIIVWKFSATFVQDCLVYGAFLFALTRAARGAAAWRQPAGIAFIAVLIHLVLTLPFSQHPALALRDFSGIVKLIAGAFAIPVVFNTREKIEAALFYSATAIALVLGYDLIRLTLSLGSNLLSQAHSFQPFILNHSNVASMMAGAAVFVFFYFFSSSPECPAVPDLRSHLGEAGCRGDERQDDPAKSRLSERSRRSRVLSFAEFRTDSTCVAKATSAQQVTTGLLHWQWRRSFWRAAGCLSGLLLCLAYLVILTSRGPQIAFALASMSAGLLIPRRSLKLLWFAVIILAGIVVGFNIKHVNPRFLEKRSMTNFSERTKVWEHTWKLALERPFFGYGYGKRSFTKIYYNTQPPKSPFHYPHPHQFWLKLLFEFGWCGLVLNLAAWAILAFSLARCVFRQGTFSERLLPGTVGLILLFIHLYGLGDYPDNIVLVAQFWLIPVALVVMKKPADEHPV